MKKLFLLLLLILWITRVEAQVVTTTPNLGMSKPCVPGDAGCDPLGHPNWGPIINSNFDILDARVPRITPARVTVATKPSIPLTDEIVVVTDALSSGTCTVAGGSANVTCQWNGSAWVPIGGGGGGSSTNFNDIGSGTNTSASMVCGTGCSITASGSGTIVATSVSGTNYMEEPSGNGIVIKNAANSSVNRQVTSSGGYLTITNPTGVGGDINLEPAVGIPHLTPTNLTFLRGNGVAWVAGTLLGCNVVTEASVFNGSSGNWQCVTAGGAGTITGSMTTGTIPKAASSSSLTDSAITEDADSVNFGKNIEACAGGTCLFALDTSVFASTIKTWGFPSNASDTFLGLTATQSPSNKTLDESSNTFKITKSVELICFDPTTNVATGDGACYFLVPVTLNGMNLTSVAANVVTAGTTGTTDIQIARCAVAASGNACSGTVADMLSTKITIDSGENGTNSAAAAAVINASNDDVATNQIIRVDVDAVGTTPPKGLMVVLNFKLP